MDIEFILNDALNKALITDRIKGVPSSNKIADFVSKYVESEKLTLTDVSQQRELLHTKVFKLANELAINGYGNEAVKMHQICNGM